jgi:polysaccharide export outer membrane protein
MVDGMAGRFLTRMFALAFVFAAALSLAANAGEPAPETTRPPYRFSGGERVKLIVPAAVGEPIEQLVSVDGWVSLQTGGTVNIRGKTIVEAQTLISETLEKQSGAKRVYAALALLDLPSQKVFVSGEVKTPQAIVVPPGSSLSLAAALASAGGPTPEADLTRVSIVQDEGGVPKSTTVDASRIGQETGNLGPQLKPDAVISIPRGDIFILAGEVVKPGSYNRRELSIRSGEPASLTRVLFGGGGLKPTANRRDVRLIRTGKDGAREVFSINLDAATRPSDKKKAEPVKGEKDDAVDEKGLVDPVLQNGDIVLASSAGGVAVLGRVRQPGVYPLGGETLKLTRLLAMAGGFADFAKTSSVIVIRASAPKTPIRIDVGAISKEGAGEKDVELEDGDLVIVAERLL